MTSRARAFLAATFALSLGACGNASDNITFAAPPGWKSMANVMSFMSMYRSPDEKQMLILMKLPFQTNDLNDAMRGQSSSARNVRLTSRQAIKICGNQDAMFASGTADTQTGNEAKDDAQGKSTKNDRDKMDMVMTSVSGVTYMAMYMHPVDRGPDGSAEAAIRQLCPQK